jgi:cytochrome c oxidase subunit 4
MSPVHVLPLRVYFTVFLCLIVFTAITVAAAFVNLGAMNNVIMIAIATIKATLVVLFFMHVRYNTRLIPVIIVSGLFFLAILFSLTFADYFSRGWLGVEGR